MEGDLLTWVEYPGNDMYQTIGNLVLDGQVSVLIPDLGKGTQVLIHGAATVTLGDPIRVVVRIESVETGRVAMQQRWQLDRPSPHNPD